MAMAAIGIAGHARPCNEAENYLSRRCPVVRSGCSGVKVGRPAAPAVLQWREIARQVRKVEIYHDEIGGVLAAKSDRSFEVIHAYPVDPGNVLIGDRHQSFEAGK